MRLFTVNGNTSDPAFKLYTFIKQHSGCRASAAARMLFNFPVPRGVRSQARHKNAKVFRRAAFWQDMSFPSFRRRGYRRGKGSYKTQIRKNRRQPAPR